MIIATADGMSKPDCVRLCQVRQNSEYILVLTVGSRASADLDVSILETSVASTEFCGLC